MLPLVPSVTVDPVKMRFSQNQYWLGIDRSKPYACYTSLYCTDPGVRLDLPM